MADLLAAMVAGDLPETTGQDAAQIRSWLRQWRGLEPIGQTDPALIAGAADDITLKGEALLAAMTDVDAGIDGDLARAGRGLATLRALGLTDDADLAAAQLTLLPNMAEFPG